MPTFLKMLAVVLAVLMMWGCAATRLSEKDERQITNVAIVSLVPEKANLERIGLTAFNNDRLDIDLGQRITTTVESVAVKRISTARPRWSIRQIGYDREVLIEKLNSFGIVMAYNEEKIEKELADLSRANGLDALFVVSSLRFDKFPGSIPGNGVGVWLRTLSLASINYAAVHSNITLKIMGSNGKIMAVSFGLPEDPKYLDTDAFGIVYQLKENLRPELVSRLSDEIIEHLTKSLNKRFDQIGM